MTTIGIFHKQADGSYRGTIKTLSLRVDQAQLRPTRAGTDKAPDFRFFAGDIEWGAAWKKTSRENREYLSVRLDDPSFPAPIHATLVEAEGGYALIWSR